MQSLDATVHGPITPRVKFAQTGFPPTARENLPMTHRGRSQQQGNKLSVSSKQPLKLDNINQVFKEDEQDSSHNIRKNSGFVKVNASMDQMMSQKPKDSELIGAKTEIESGQAKPGVGKRSTMRLPNDSQLRRSTEVSHTSPSPDDKALQLMGSKIDRQNPLDTNGLN